MVSFKYGRPIRLKREKIYSFKIIVVQGLQNYAVESVEVKFGLEQRINFYYQSFSVQKARY